MNSFCYIYVHIFLTSLVDISMHRHNHVLRTWSWYNATKWSLHYYSHNTSYQIGMESCDNIGDNSSLLEDHTFWKRSACSGSKKISMQTFILIYFGVCCFRGRGCLWLCTAIERMQGVMIISSKLLVMFSNTNRWNFWRISWMTSHECYCDAFFLKQ